MAKDPPDILSLFSICLSRFHRNSQTSSLLATEPVYELGERQRERERNQIFLLFVCPFLSFCCSLYLSQKLDGWMGFEVLGCFRFGEGDEKKKTAVSYKNIHRQLGRRRDRKKIRSLNFCPIFFLIFSFSCFSPGLLFSNFTCVTLLLFILLLLMLFG